MSGIFRRQSVVTVLAGVAWGFLILSAFCFRPDVEALQAAATTKDIATFNNNAASPDAAAADNALSQDDIAALSTAAALDNPDMLERIAGLRDGVPAGTDFMLLGGLVLGLALWIDKRAQKAAATVGTAFWPPARISLPAIRWQYVLPGGILLWLIGEVTGDYFNMAFLTGMSHHLQFILFCLGIGLVVWGMRGKPQPAAVPVRRSVHRTRDLFLITGIFFLAFALRFWDLSYTARVLVDELHFMSGVLEFNKRGDIELMSLINSLSPFARLFTYWQYLLVELFGRNFLGFRAISALLGTFNVLAIYWLAKTLFDRKTALLAALFLATFPPHLHFSRLGIIQTGDMFFGSLTLAFLARGFKTGRSIDWVLAGASLGMTQYFYEGGRLLFPLIVLIWIAGVFLANLNRKDRTHPPTRGHVGRLLLTAFLVALPLYYATLVYTGPVTRRLDASGFDENYWISLLLSSFKDGWLQSHLLHLESSFLVYVHMPERAVYYGGYHPFVLEVFVPLFLMGVWYVIWRGGARRFGLLLWVILTSIGSGLLVQSAVASRFVVVFPALAVLVAVGLRYGLPLIWPKTPALKRPLTLTLIGAGLLIAGVQAVYYFGDHLPTFNAQFRHARLYRDVEDAILRAAEYPPETQVHIIMSVEFDISYNRDFLNFLVDGLEIETLHTSQFTAKHVASLDRKQAHVFLLEPDDETSRELIAARFPLGEPVFSPYPDVPPDEQFALYFVPGYYTGASS